MAAPYFFYASLRERCRQAVAKRRASLDNANNPHEFSQSGIGMPRLTQQHSNLGWWTVWRRLGRYGTLIVVAGMTLWLAIACSTSTPQTTLTIALPGIDASRWRSLIDRFEQQHPDIHLAVTEAHESTDELETIYSDAFADGATYDLVYADIVWVPKFAAAGWLMPLGDRISEDALADFLPNDRAGSYYNDQLYRLPMRSDIGVLHYRQDLLQTANQPVPETFDALLAAAERLQAEDLVSWGYLWQGRPYEGLSATFAEVLAGYGGFWIDPETLEIGLGQPEALQALEFLRQTIETGIAPERVTSYSEEETYRLFQDGEAAFLRNWPETWATVNSIDSDMGGKIAIAPVLHAEGQISRGCQGGWGLAIAANTDHPDAAWTAAQFFTSAEAQRQLALEVGYLPSRRSLYTDPAIVQHYSYYPELLDLMNQSVMRPAIPNYVQVSEILQRYVHAALTDRLSPEQALAATVEETQTVLAGGS